ncbi:MAG: anti-sigma factor antagonist [Saprospirales bacterium]|jgi:anti-sigma B factor antagonist|nr:MAG: anti-sigma factor antagonist [Saprospirales bacterium]
MKYELDKQEKYTIFKANEENINSLIAPQLKSEFIFLHNEGVRNLVIDLSNVKYIDSSGLSAILTANRLWKNNGSMVVTGVDNNHVKKIIEISRLDSILTIIPTIEESVEYVMMEEIERELLQGSEEE